MGEGEPSQSTLTVSVQRPVLVIGAGPAGASAAIFLRQRGLPVVLMDRQAQRCLKIGESLPPAANSLLTQLGVLPEFVEQEHAPCFGNCSYWFTDVPQYHDFLRRPGGRGWHLDRRKFEELLIAKAKDAGAEVHVGARLRALTQEGSHWKGAWLLQNDSMCIGEYDYVIDATGRSSWLARRQGAKRKQKDEQMALVCFLRSDLPLVDSTSLVETTPHGWWYSAKVPGGGVATAFIFEPDLTQPLRVTKAQWWNLIKSAPHTWARLKGLPLHLDSAPKFVKADSSIMDQLHGVGWVAIGDAAMTYDPIASHGLMMGMVSARDAVLALTQPLPLREAALAEYSALMHASFDAYCEQRKQFYHHTD